MSVLERKAFTMIEFIMVLTVIAILAVVVMPKGSVLEDARLEQAAMEVISRVRYAQRLARTRHQVYGVSFSSDTDRYAVFEGDDTSNVIPDPGDIESFQTDVNAGIFPGLRLEIEAFFDGSGVIKFNHKGEPLSGDTDDTLVNPGTVSISNGESEKVLRIDPGTGRVHE